MPSLYTLVGTPHPPGYTVHTAGHGAPRSRTARHDSFDREVKEARLPSQKPPKRDKTEEREQKWRFNRGFTGVSEGLRGFLPY